MTVVGHSGLGCSSSGPYVVVDHASSSGSTLSGGGWRRRDDLEPIIIPHDGFVHGKPFEEFGHPSV